MTPRKEVFSPIRQLKLQSDLQCHQDAARTTNEMLQCPGQIDAKSITVIGWGLGQNLSNDFSSTNTNKGNSLAAQISKLSH